MANATTLQLGAWSPLTDTFVAHPNSPTNAIYNLNDQANWTIVDAQEGFGTGLEITPPRPEVLKVGNSRAVGERVTRRNYSHNRTIRVNLLQLPQTTQAAWNANLRNLIQLCEGISQQQPAALQIQLTSSSTPTYADIVEAHVSTRYKETLFQQYVNDEVTLELECRPFLRGPRQTLSNLIVNPGFEAPSGAGGVTAFTDSFANLFAYSGSGLLQDIVSFSDALLPLTPIRWYRQNEASGTTATDSGSQAQNGTYSGTFSLNNAGICASSSDTTAIFNGGQQASAVTGLPSGNGSWSMGCGFNMAGLPAALAVLLGWGTHTTNQRPAITIDNTGAVKGDVWTNNTAGYTVTINTTHFAVLTWDGTTLTLYVDGVSRATATPGALNVGTTFGLIVGQDGGSSFPFNGAISNAFVCNYTLSGAQVTTLSNAFLTAAAAAHTLRVPAGNTATFGSTSWGAISQWQVRFRYRNGITAMFNAHTTVGGSLGAEVGAGTLYLQQTVGGTQHILANVSFTTTNDYWYWLTFTQFPASSGGLALVMATIYSDSNGSLGTQLAAIGSTATFDGVTALSGQAQFQVNGAALGVGGANVSRATHTLALFGPGAWLFFPTDGTTGVASGAWEQNGANTYGGGATYSYSCARIDAAPAGTLGGNWESYAGGAPAGTAAISVAPSQTVGVSAWVRSSGVGAACTQTLQVLEYDASGAFLRGSTVATHTGSSGWVQLTGTYTTGASCAYIGMRLEAFDSTTGSAGGVIWFDNAQCWNITTTGQTSMPYCELRFHQSPAQLLVTGILGDVPAPALMSVGAYFSSIPQGTTLSLRVGQRALPTRGFVGIAYPIVIGTVASGGVTFASATLGASYYGGALFTNNINVNTSYAAQITWTPPSTDDQQVGVYHLFARVSNSNTSANVALMTVRAEIFQKLGVAGTALLAAYYGAYLNAGLTTQNLLTISDTGQLQIPASAFGALTDLSQLASLLDAQFSDPTSSTTTFSADYLMLLPIDGAYLAATINNPSNASVQNAVWLWVYNDGTQTQQALTPAWRYSLESSGIPAPAHGVGITGTQSTGYLNINPAAQPSLSLDPRPNLNGVSGVAQLVAQWNDQNAAILPLAAEFVYSPLYLWPL